MGMVRRWICETHTDHNPRFRHFTLFSVQTSQGRLKFYFYINEVLHKLSFINEIKKDHKSNSSLLYMQLVECNENQQAHIMKSWCFVCDTQVHKDGKQSNTVILHWRAEQLKNYRLQRWMGFIDGMGHTQAPILR